MKANYNFIFIGGCGRSGTTMIQNTITNHSRVNGGAEFGFTSPIFDVYESMLSNFNKNNFKNVDSESDLNEYFRSFYSSFFKDFEDESIKYLSEKTPNNIFVSQELLNVFPNALFIYVYRDGRDVVASHSQVKKRYKKKDKFADFTLKSISQLWYDAQQKYNALSSSPYSKRVYAIQYENFVKEPQNEIKRLLEFLDLPYEDIDSSSESKSEKERAYVNDVWYSETMLNQSINTQNISKWKKDLNFFQKVIVQIRTAPTLKALNYEIKPIYLRLHAFCKLFSKDSLRKTYIYGFYRKIRLKLS